MAGSHDDAVLLVGIAQWGAMSGVPDAAGMIWADEFDPDSAEANDPAVRTVLAFFETVANDCGAADQLPAPDGDGSDLRST